MKKLLSLLLIICSIGVAYADDTKTATSLKYVTDELNTRQDKFGANDGKAMTFTNVAGGNLPRDVKASLGTSTSDTGLPTVSAVNTGIATKQDEIGAANTNTVVTYTSTPGTLGQKGIYQDTGTYVAQSDNLIQASTFNAALRNGLENEFVCADSDPVSNQCWLWTIHNEENVGKNLFDVNDLNIGSVASDTVNYKSYAVPNGTYTMSTPDFPTGSSTANIFFLAGDVSSGASSASNGVLQGTSRTINVTNGYYTIGYRSGASNPNNPKNYSWQIELGSTATEYEPYNSNSIQVPGKNLFNDIENRAYVNAGDTVTISLINTGRRISVKDNNDATLWTISSGQTGYQTGTITIPNDVTYLYIAAYNTTAMKDVQIELGDTATPYEPYTEETVNVYIPQNQTAQNP